MAQDDRPCYNYKTQPIPSVYRNMATNSDRTLVNRRIILFTVILAATILAGVVLFFLYVGRVDPLVQAVLPIITTTITTT
jgi:amino acid permease